MRVLIALDEHHRPVHRDNGRAIDGELVTPVVLTCTDHSCVSCQSSWYGLVSHGECAVAMVVERPGVSEADIRTRLHGWLDCLGVVDQAVQAAEATVHDGEPYDPVVAVGDVIDDHLAEIRQICETFPVGTIVSRLGSLVAPRPLGLAA